MDQGCDGPNRVVKQERKVNGMGDWVDNANGMVEQEESTGSAAGPLFSGAKPKRLRSKVWDDFTPIFIDGKVARAECMHCHQVFNSNSSSGTSNLLKHQAKCSPQAQKRQMQQKLPFLPSSQKSMGAAGSDPTQKKLLFLPTSLKECSGTADAMAEKKDLALPDIPADTNRKSQKVDQNGSHEELATPEQKNLALPDIPTNKNWKNQSQEELAGSEQKDIPTEKHQKNLGVDQKGSHEDLVRTLAMHGYLPSMDHDRFRAFKKFVACLNPMVKMPSNVDLYLNFTGLFDTEKAKLKEKFAALRSQVCLSAYVWHYDPLLAFLCLSVHYIDDEWERQQKIITFRAVDHSCNAEVLSGVILRAIGDWGLRGKVFSIALDDAFIDDSVASNVKASLQKWNLLSANRSLSVSADRSLSVSADRSLFVVRYVTHLLDQVIQVGLDELEKIMEKSAKYSKYTKGPTPSAVQYPNCRYTPSPEDWSKAQNICRILQDFHQYMAKMHKCHRPGDLFDRLWHVKKYVHPEAHFYKDKTISNVLEKMQKKFKEHWKLCCLNICMPMVLDPLYRLEHIKSRILFNLNNDIEDYIHEVHDILLNLFDEYSGQVKDPNCTSGSKTSKETVVNRDDTRLEYYHYSEYPYSERPMTELDQYLQEPHLSTGQLSVLRWWKGHNLTYPTIARMARDILAIPRSTDCKVATRTARRAICESGGNHWIEEIVCTQDWLRSDGSASEMSTSDLF